ncbi:MAG: efflux RND transporter periplasmic adaptor subunit [Verrucomicrobia bacterium]|nr:efflux RND transporter periplasmic adaptor subunit [Verrucomicrobiota bacterium]
MLRKILLPSLAACGAIAALLVVFWSQKTELPQPVPFPPATSPYPHYIAGAGIVEASSQNISIGSPFSEIVTKLYVVEGDRVKKGDPLFHLDLRSFEAQLETSRNQLKADIVNLENQKTQFSFYERLTDKRAVSQQDYESAYYALKQAEAQVEVARAAVMQVETDIQRAIIRAPVDGEILQVNVHLGEIAPVVPYISTQATLILMGTVQPLQMRIDIDEDDAWRYVRGANATAFVRGNSNIHFPLKFLRIEPYIIPKASFTGETTERVDTRVLQVLYNFEKADLPVYAGQVLDVFIESPAVAEANAPAPSQTAQVETRFGP